jgi:hypothetical protein
MVTPHTRVYLRFALRGSSWRCEFLPDGAGAPLPRTLTFADHRLDALGQPIEAAPHVGRFRCKPDPWTRRAIQRMQTRQTDHDAISKTASKRR